ncbi:hypothetical protein PH210_25820 [Paenibacillus sp. BSR1-1]|uniref:hypothetical protein n=1 Tax=Paenibacillus sp. BSR1-1 TaxID=3020845 RepID=UPI0025AF8493|nr:hypothetical protein [Paenibacillus sp. BSR1-1]MDN3019587.1 hypothetical protein [Paenibacillus sp. BSR1-1]
MFNDYLVFQMMKLRQEEIERKANEAWKFYDQIEDKELMMHSVPSVNLDCQCACAQ